MHTTVRKKNAFHQFKSEALVSIRYLTFRAMEIL